MKTFAAYEAWNTALAERYFSRENRGKPAYLSVDDDELAEEITPADAEPGAESLATAVRLTLGSGDGRFGWHIGARDEWREHESGYPPYIGLLGLCVLAASRMAREPTKGIESNAYYPQLNPLIGLATFGGQPSGFELVGSLWRDLNRWLDSHDGAYGTSTARQHSHFIHVGWPMSQCLLRRADRYRLTDFFRSAGLEPDEDIEAGQLLVLFRAWARPGCGLSAPAIRITQNASGAIADEIAEILAREYEVWEGELRDRRGRRRGMIALTLSMAAGGRRASLGLSPRRPEGFPDDAIVETPAGQPVEISAVSDDWYAPLGIPVTADLLQNGLFLEAPGFSLAYDASEVVPLRASLGAARWVSVRQADLFEEHCVLVSNRLLPGVRDFLEKHADRGFSEIETNQLPRGWHVFRGVRFTRAVALAPPDLTPLAPRMHTATRIAGGLQLAPALYLTGGEPDVWISIGEGETATVELDGEPTHVKGALELRLSTLEPPLGEGQHELLAGGIRRHFTTTTGFPVVRPAGAAEYGHVFERHNNYLPKSIDAVHLGKREPPKGTVYVSGASVIGDPADLPQAPAEPVLIPNGLTNYVVLGASPYELISPIPPQKPRWIRRFVNAPGQFFDCPVPFAAQWVIARGRDGIQVRALQAQPLPPDPGEADPAESVPATWCAAVLHAAEAGAQPLYNKDIWQQYVQAASLLAPEAVNAAP